MGFQQIGTEHLGPDRRKRKPPIEMEAVPAEQLSTLLAEAIQSWADDERESSVESVVAVIHEWFARSACVVIRPVVGT